MMSTRPVSTTIICPIDGCEGEWHFEGQACPADIPAGHPTRYVDWDLDSAQKEYDHTCGRERLEWPDLEAALGAAEDECHLYGGRY